MSETDFSAHIPGAAQTKPVIPRFRTEAVHQPFKSTQEGRAIFEDREFVDILIPGDRRTVVSEPVNDEHKTRWPKEYEAFRAGKELPLSGTPLANWPNSQMTRSRVEELAYHNIRTVEHLAAVNDINLQNLGMGAREMRAAAQKFLDVAAHGTGPLEKLVTENLHQNDKISVLERQMAEMGEKLSQLMEKSHERH